MPVHSLKIPGTRVYNFKEMPVNSILKTRGLGLLIILMVIQGLLFLFVPYGLALHRDHVYKFWPYISDTGNFSPERSWFTVFLNLTGFLAIVICYIRYHLILSINKADEKRVRRLNYWALLVAGIAILGTVLVGAFQEDQISSMHGAGAFITFAFGWVYMILSTLISYRSQCSALWLRRVRLALTIITAIAGFFFRING